MYKTSSKNNELDHLINLLGKVPGLGPRSARRAALQLIKKKDSLMKPLSSALADVAENVHPCATCGNLDIENPCHICESPKRDRSIICVIEDVSDLWALDRAGSYRGLYHVIGGTLSALDGVGPDDLNINTLIERANDSELKEIIIATNATVDGQTTAHYITEQLKSFDLTITRLAHGVPIGGELDYLDDGTLTTALNSRRPF
ncbi:MAG: recombination mediator RecR [Emcibacteraceae bacterium]|jgi:recombination protein RecR|uniref:recombination mediator RecR n=1 Tax=Pseudemcibacter sp. TaxID=2943293 RepID=UPI003F69B09E|nr:recombination protein RecR [Kordiimonadaceae bacterium]MDG1020438.1 recombination mediator RecR [Emcibacteraceae bacterium]MDG1726340.1 recombination mediator RecR [Emcibacteraceae bacterium]